MRKYVTLALFLAVTFVLTTSTGCVFDADHNERHWRAFKRDLHEAHHFIDKHFFNYDREDPDNW